MEFEFKDVRAMTVCDSLIMLSAEEFGLYMSKATIDGMYDRDIMSFMNEQQIINDYPFPMYG